MMNAAITQRRVKAVCYIADNQRVRLYKSSLDESTQKDNGSNTSPLYLSVHLPWENTFRFLSVQYNNYTHHFLLKGGSPELCATRQLSYARPK